MIHGLLLDLDSRGVVLWVEGTDLHYRAPAGAITPEVKALLSEHKTELVELLAEGKRAALESWTTSVNQVAPAWDTYAARCRAADEEPAWLEDVALTGRVASAIRAGDLAATMAAIVAWEAAWKAIIGPKVSAPGSRAIAVNQLLDEVDSRRRPPNASVHAMFHEARRRFGSGNQEARSITAWLRLQAPEVAARWPEAPVSASWLDWRRELAREHMPVLDEAWSAVTGQPRFGGGERA